MGRGLRLRLIWWWMGVTRLQLTPRRAHFLFGWNIFAAVVCTCSWTQSSSLFTPVCRCSSSSASHCCGSHQSCVASGEGHICHRGSLYTVNLLVLLLDNPGSPEREGAGVTYDFTSSWHRKPENVVEPSTSFGFHTHAIWMCTKCQIMFPTLGRSTDVCVRFLFFDMSPTRCERRWFKNFFLLIQHQLHQTLCLSQWV